MAILHKAEIHPSKLDLISAWLRKQPWAYDATEPWERTAAYRFDDPAGEVGVETMLVRAGDGAELQVPLTYRGAPLEGADAWLLGTAEHSVLGTRWFYDAAGDPVYAQVLAQAILGGGREAEVFYETDAGRESVPGSAEVRGSGSAPIDGIQADPVEAATSGAVTTIATPSFELLLVREIGVALPARVRQTLTGTWDTQPEPVLLAAIADRA
ncbi:hypothetical protein [Diaminobutyricimonas sp. LJ205]|uniref:CG0192-related protein n=1 Tax=Diaminobutyricimonas sp. LJ205 TaxID=2683590 RepID=UPI0012F4B597|nr:hypothetical protein [Diaminobutyricimonas sp. LJ205]